MSSCDRKELFIKTYNTIQQYLLDDAVGNMQLDTHRREYLRHLMDANCLGGKYNRGMTIIDVADTLSRDVTGREKEELLFLAAVAGWMIEFMQAHFLVEDDIMDHSITRRGNPCWYRFPGVTTQSAINDGLILFAWANKISAHYFSGKSFFPKLLMLFHQTDYATTIGQMYDVTSMRNSEDVVADTPLKLTTDYKEYTIDNWRRIVTHKTSYYTYYCPLAMGLLITEHLHRTVVSDKTLLELALVMGEYFQASDDFMDCFVDPAILGKIGTDIEDMKCSWLAVNFIKVATPEQFAAFKAHYGKCEPEHVAYIKQLYKDSQMSDVFAAYEADIVLRVEGKITALEKSSKEFSDACRTLWLKTYKRRK